MSTDELIKGCLQGKGSHFSELYEKYSSGLYYICMRYAGDSDEAKDLLQEGFVKVFQKLSTYDASRGTFDSWLKRIFINLCIDYYRKQKNTASAFPIEQVADEIADIDDEPVGLVNNLTYEELVEAISELPVGYRTVFNMYVIDEKGHKEIASALNISESTSKTQLFKARNLLQKNLMLKTTIRVK
ncbi:MAG: RNA polymerase sigma factor [Bacteroidota bacterium]